LAKYKVRRKIIMYIIVEYNTADYIAIVMEDERLAVFESEKEAREYADENIAFDYVIVELP